MVDVTQFFGLKDPQVESYNFTYFEDLFAQQAKAPTPVNVLAKSYRNVQLHNAGKYKLLFTYNNGMTTEANWEVLPVSDCKKAKNLIFFVSVALFLQLSPSLVLLRLSNLSYSFFLLFQIILHPCSLLFRS